MIWDSSLCPGGAVAGTANISFALPVSPLYIRITQTGAGAVTMVVTQYNVVNA